jgi:hypothetical protein
MYEFRKFQYGPSVTEHVLIVENEDGEGGGYDIYHHANYKELREAAIAHRKDVIESRAKTIVMWKSHNWSGIGYDKLQEYTLFLYPAGSTRWGEDLSIPEELTGLL